MIDLTEQLAIVAAGAQCEWRAVLMWSCLYSLAAVAAGVLLWFLARNLSKISLRAWPLVLVAILYGGTKPSHLWSFTFSNGLSDNGSECSGDEIRGKWTLSSALLDGYSVKMRYRDASVTNSAGTVTDSWHDGEDTLASALQHTWSVTGATNMQVMIWAQYVSPVVVHTNGVYKLGGVMREMGDTQKYLTPGTRCLINTDTGEIKVITPTNRPCASLATLQEDSTK